MKILKYSAWTFGALLVLVILAVFLYVGYLKKAAVPDYNKTVVLEGITGEVTVFRDEFGIPHIYASNEEDLYRAVGFVMAQDRLWQMDILRRLTSGRLSELLGDIMLNTDLLMRSLRISDKSEKLLAGFDPAIRSALEAFSEGVNHYMQKYPLPPEFKVLGYHPEPWEPVHSINLIGYMSWDLTTPWDNEVVLQKIVQEVDEEFYAEMKPDLVRHPSTIISDYQVPEKIDLNLLIDASDVLKKLGIEIFHGSNNWVVSGMKSVSGKPILANDMHLGFNIPGIWYQMHLVSENSLNVTGVAVPGQPFIISGHNDSIAWGMTNVMLDDMDFYIETVNEDSTRYLLDGEWKELEVRKEIIRIKGGKQVEKVLRYTHRGPMISQFRDLKEPFISMRWIGNEWSDEMSSVYKLNRASNWEDFRDATKTFISVSQNIVYADVRGNIGIQVAAGIPVREGEIFTFFPGNTSKHDWKGIVPFEELPYEYNPDRGYVSSANNKTIGEDYPYPVSYWFFLPDRIDRIREMLEAKEKLSVEDFTAIQTDFRSKLPERILPHIYPLLEEYGGLDEKGKLVVSRLKTWDYVMAPGSMEASVFENLYRKIIENLVRDDLSEEVFRQFMDNRLINENFLLNILHNTSSSWVDIRQTPEKETFHDIVAMSFHETLDELTSKISPDPEQWRWDNLLSFTLEHPLGSVNLLNKVLKLNRGPFRVGGSYHTVSPFSYSFIDPFRVTEGASQRHVYDLSNWSLSKTVIPTGNSGVPSSPHYCDQTELYLNGQYHDDLFTLREVMDRAKYTMKIKGPQKR
jgi:penicillin G amidase